jgi:mannose-1-phosphate guanylyltransferase
MIEQKVAPVILCGGSGTRLWPRSRAAMPKPFLRLVGERTLFEEALMRCSGDSMFAPPVVVTGAAHLELVETQSRDFAVAEIIVEPEPKQTAAAIALAALRLHEETIMLVCPSDHHIGDAAAFRRAAAAAAETATNGWLVCIAVAPSNPDTRFGYVRRGEPLGRSSFRVASFVEKPDQASAADYVASDLYAWNAGIFAFRAGDYLRELRKFRPALTEAVERSAARGELVGNRFFPERQSFAQIKPESLDYAVMENTNRAALVTTEMEWSDVGNWEALFRIREKDEWGNAVCGSAQLIDCANVLVDSDGPRVHMIGVENIVVIVDGDDILVASASDARSVADLNAAK